MGSEWGMRGGFVCFQAEDGIRDPLWSRGLGDVYEGQIQRRLMEEQVERGRGGEKETQPLDEDFLRAMEYGMPPMGGVGFGIDRIVMLLTGQLTIRDVIFFPTMRPES